MQTYRNQKKSERRPRLFRSLGIQLLVYALLVFSTPAFLSAAVFQVPPGDVPGLIAAINTANANGEENAIILGAGTYTLTTADNIANGLPLITGKMTIRGQGSSLTTIEGAGAFPAFSGFRIFRIEPTGVLALDSLAVRRGSTPSRSGGGILFNLGDLTITESDISEGIVVTGVGGGGIWNLGNLRVRFSRIFENSVGDASGGGILNDGTASIEDSFIFLNGSNDPFIGAGGGILNVGELNLTRTNVVNNVAGVNGAGLANFGKAILNRVFISLNVLRFGIGPSAGGGGIFNRGEELSIVSSTIAENTVERQGGAGIFNASGHVTVASSTIVGNSIRQSLFFLTGFGGGLINLDRLEIQNSIVALNSAATAPDCSGSPSSLGNNIIGDTSGCLIVLKPTDLTGDPGLGELIDDGAPGHGRFPLLSGSRAIDAGNDAGCPPTDQLGTPRNGACDIGAVEFYPTINNLVALGNVTTAFDPTPVPGGPAGTFRITADFTNTSVQTIIHPFAEVVELTGGNLLLNADGGPGGVGARLTLPNSVTTPFEPGANSTLEFLIGLQRQEPFTFLVNMLGEPQTSKTFVSRR